MTQSIHFAAIDLGAESGRVMLADLVAETLTIKEVHRFSNGPIEQDGALHWDFGRLMNEIKTGLKKAFAAQPAIASIGVDTWGVDYGLIDRAGRLIENPYHYRDRRTSEMIETACSILGRETIYNHTGIQFMPFNTVFQLLACQRQRPELLERADTLLLMPNLIMYELCGAAFAEYTIASTTQLMDMKTGGWSDAILNGLGLPQRILPEIRMPGEQVGTLKAQLAQELGGQKVPIVSVGTHDTASAVAAVPVTHDKSWAYLSSGTWSLMGLEIPAPVIHEQSFALDYTNEGGIGNTIRLLKNIMGLWLVQECRRHWAGEGEDLNYTQITQMATEAQPFTAVLNTDYGEFFSPGQMPQKINQYLAQTGQDSITDKGQMVRTVLESLALKYTSTMDNLKQLGGRPIEVLHIVGGGIQNELLNQLTADATGKTVITGPVEATVIGNVLMQALVAGRIKNLSEGRAIVAQSFAGKEYQPGNVAAWDQYRTKAASLPSI